MFEARRRIDFYEADGAGILFFANVYKIAHSVYEEFLDTSFANKNIFNDEEIVIPIIHSEADYRKIILPGEKIKIRLFVEQIRDSVFSLKYLFVGQNEELRVEVKTVHVAVSKKNFKKTKLPLDLSELLKKHLKNKTD